VLKEVPGAKPDGCPISDLDLGPEFKGAQLRGHFGAARRILRAWGCCCL